jgi:cytosine/adenosine deaminase-related metal-dependent hydrolase
VIRVVCAPWVLTGAPEGGPLPQVIADGAVALDGDAVVAVGSRAALTDVFGPARPLDAVLLPALVNAHLHLELSHLAGRVPGGDGLPAWIERFVKARLAAAGAPAAPGSPEAAAEAAAVAEGLAEGVVQLARAGVAAVGDVSNSLGSLPALAAGRLTGTIFHEVFGASAERFAAARARAKAIRKAALLGPGTGLRVVESPHAVYSTHPAGLLELLAGPPASLHLAEDPAEREFVSTGGGPFGALRARMGGAPGQPGWARSAVALAAPHLRPGWLAVHLVDLDGADLDALAASGATAVLCPRSNQHISRALPPLPRLLAAGVPLAVGTDSLASCPSLAPLAELATLRRAFPEVPARRLLPLAWNGAAVGAPTVGRLVAGFAPGVLAAPLGGARPADPFEFLASGEGAFGRPVEWLARHRPEIRPC